MPNTIGIVAVAALATCVGNVLSVVLDRHVFALDVPGFAEALVETAHPTCLALGRPVSDKPDHRHRWLLRVRRERPSRHSAADRFDKIASPHRRHSS